MVPPATTPVSSGSSLRSPSWPRCPRGQTTRACAEEGELRVLVRVRDVRRNDLRANQLGRLRDLAVDDLVVELEAAGREEHGECGRELLVFEDLGEGARPRRNLPD